MRMQVPLLLFFTLSLLILPTLAGSTPSPPIPLSTCGTYPSGSYYIASNFPNPINFFSCLNFSDATSLTVQLDGRGVDLHAFNSTYPLNMISAIGFPNSGGRVEIRNVKISGGPQIGIQVKGVEYVLIENNYIDEASLAITTETSDQINIINNTISSSSLAVHLLTGVDAVIQSNTVLNTSTGIEVYGSFTHVTLSKNFFLAQNSDSLGMYVWTMGQVDILNNEFRGTGSLAALVYGDCTITGNLVDDFGTAFNVNGDVATISNNTITRSSFKAIFLTITSFANVTFNFLANSTGFGIQIPPAVNATAFVTGNIIVNLQPSFAPSEVLPFCIDVYTSSAFIQNNVIQHTREVGAINVNPGTSTSQPILIQYNMINDVSIPTGGNLVFFNGYGADLVYENNEIRYVSKLNCGNSAVNLVSVIANNAIINTSIPHKK